MLKRLIIVLVVGLGIVFVPYWMGFLMPELIGFSMYGQMGEEVGVSYAGYWVDGGLILLISFLAISLFCFSCVGIVQLYKYIKYGK